MLLNASRRKISEADRVRTLRLREKRKAAGRIQNELRLHEQGVLSLATIHKMLGEAGVDL
jgi:hypothetical protein